MCSSDVAKLVFGYLSDQGLEETKNIFSKESPDLLGKDPDNDFNREWKLSLIIKEYSILKEKEKKGKPTDPESVLLFLWKQFDVLVGQLKHMTIHNSEKEKNRAKRGFRDQKARVRELNKQNRAAFQQKNKSLAAREALMLPEPTNGLMSEPVNPQLSPQSSINSQYVHITPYPTLPYPTLPYPTLPQSTNITPSHNVANNAPLWKTPTKCVVQSNVVISESIQELNSGEQLQSCNEQLLPSDQFKSPKRKSVPPKKRTGETVPGLPPAQVSTKSSTITSTQTSTQEDSQLDIQSIVDKILDRPELPEKLAENINRAVEIDASANQQSDLNTETESSAQTQSAVVSSNKVDDIMEMMKSDPVFEELFSSFDNFESNFEESDAGQAKADEPKTSNPSSTSLQNDKCDNEALDALLLLASSPVRPHVQISESLETPQKGNASVALSSPLVASTSSVPVVLSPGNISPMKRPSQPIVSHVRQLNFSGTGKTAGNGNASQGTFTEVNISASIVLGIKPTEASVSDIESSKGKISKEVLPGREDKSSESKSSEDNRSKTSEGQVFEGENLSSEDVICVSSNEQSVEGTSKINLDRMKENAEVSIVEEKREIGQEKRVENTPVVFQSEKKQSDSSSEGNECVKGNVVGYKDIARCNESSDKTGTGNNTTDINITDTDKCSRNKETTSFKDSPLKLIVLEDLATNELLECQSKVVKPAETTGASLKSSPGVSKRYLPTDSDEEGCNRTIDVMLCEPMETKDTESSDGLTPLTEGIVSNIGGFTNIKTPENTKILGNDLGSSADSDKTSKRKLKKKKKSTRTSKKAKMIPEDLDVDKFLSRLHYVQAEKT